MLLVTTYTISLLNIGFKNVCGQMVIVAGLELLATRCYRFGPQQWLETKKDLIFSG